MIDFCVYVTKDGHVMPDMSLSFLRMEEFKGKFVRVSLKVADDKDIYQEDHHERPPIESL